MQTPRYLPPVSTRRHAADTGQVLIVVWGGLRIPVGYLHSHYCIEEEGSTVVPHSVSRLLSFKEDII